MVVMTLPKRFKGKTGRTLLVKILRRQKLVADDLTLAQELAAVASISTLRPQTTLISKGEYKAGIYLILSGKVEIRDKQTFIANRHSGDHVGEMALIDPQHPRSASVITLEKTEVAKISESKFTVLADRHPVLWRRLALELGDRLRQRGRFVPTPNKKPIIFIGSSSEQKRAVNLIARALARSKNKIEIKKWTSGVFGLSETFIESLETTMACADFAILLLSGDDTVIHRGAKTVCPRDNCIFELGLAMGALGRKRSIILKPKGTVRLPSDLAGITRVEYNSDPKSLNAAVKKIATRITQLGTK